MRQAVECRGKNCHYDGAKGRLGSCKKLINRETMNIIGQKLRNRNLFALIVCVGFLGLVNANVPESEKNALLALYHNTDGHKWNITWDLDGDITAWHGIKVANGHIVGVDLFRNNLNGNLPDAIGDLGYLEHLNLAFNDIGGSIPESISKLGKLKVLKLEMNRLTGVIPPQIGNMTALMRFTAFNNFLGGQLPQSMGKLVHLKELNLSSNGLTGRIPDSLGELSKLESLGLFENRLIGSVPKELGKLVALRELILANNELEGMIPQEFGQLASLEVFQIQNNNILSFENYEDMDFSQFLVFDYDMEKIEIQYKDFDVHQTRTVNTKFEDKE